MKHIKIFSAAVFALLLCGGLKAAQPELPCGVTLFFDFKTAETNSVKTGRLGLTVGSTNWYRAYQQSVIQSFDVTGIHNGSLNSTYTETHPQVHHSGGSGCVAVPFESWTDDADVFYETMTPPSTCSASRTYDVWSDGGTCAYSFGLSANQYHTQVTYNWEINDPPATDSADEYHASWSGGVTYYQYHVTTTLDNVYTTSELIENATSALIWPSEWSNDGGSARVTILGEGERCVMLRGLKYRLRYVGPKGESGTFKWIERLKPANGGAFIDKVKEHHVSSFTGVEQQSEEYTVDPPMAGGEVVIVGPDGAVSGCSRCTLAQADFENGSASFSFGLGSALFGQSAGLLYVMENYPGAVHTRQTLKASTPRGLVFVLTNSGGLRQVKAPNAFVNVTDITGGYGIDFYSSAGPTNAITGFFDLPGGSPLASWTVVQVNSSPYSVEVRQNGSATNTYTYLSGGSTRSCRTPLSRSATPTRRFHSHWKSTHKTQTKCIQKCEFYLVKDYPKATYNCNAIKCLSFTGAFPVLTLKSQSLGTESHDVRPKKPVDRYPFSLGEEVRMRDKPVESGKQTDRANKLANTVQNETKRDGSGFFKKPTTLYQRLMTTPPALVSFSREVPMPVADEVTSL